MLKNTRRQFGKLLLGASLRYQVRSSNTIDQEIEILPDEQIGVIRPELHGQFAEHLGASVYGGLWVGTNSTIPNVNGYRKAAIEYLRALGVPVVRWPGGCFADEYHWRDGIGPPNRRPKTVNSHSGYVVEDNSFGTHEFVELCQLIGAQPYLAGNVGSGSPRELRDWMEYCNFAAGSSLADERIRNGAEAPFRVKYWGVGNDIWGCGGNLTGTEYAADYRRFGTFLSPFGDMNPFLVACGPSQDNQEWTEQFLSGLHGKRLPDGYAMHYRSNAEISSTKFTLDEMTEQFATIPKLEEAILHQRRLLDKADPDRKMGLVVDEWDVLDPALPEGERHLTMRTAVTTALTLNAFHRQADKLAMCTVAQMANVRNAMLLTSNEKCIRTPSYYAFLLAKIHQGKIAVRVTPPQANPTELSISASCRDNALAVTIVNPKPRTDIRIRCAVRGHAVTTATGRSLWHQDWNAFNSFDKPDTVVPRKIEVQVRPEGLIVNLPSLSVTTLEVELA